MVRDMLEGVFLLGEGMDAIHVGPIGYHFALDKVGQGGIDLLSGNLIGNGHVFYLLLVNFIPLESTVN